MYANKDKKIDVYSVCDFRKRCLKMSLPIFFIIDIDLQTAATDLTFRPLQVFRYLIDFLFLPTAVPLFRIINKKAHYFQLKIFFNLKEP